jgi:hypothetical protein
LLQPNGRLSTQVRCCDSALWQVRWYWSHAMSTLQHCR